MNNRYSFNTSQLENNCGIWEIGDVAATFLEEAPEDEEWLDAILTESIQHFPIVVFSYNHQQTLKSSEPYNIYRFGEWLKAQGETFTVTPWVRNGSMGNKIQMATWHPSAKFKNKVARAEIRFAKAGRDSY